MFSTSTVNDLHCHRLASEVTDIDALAKAVALILIQEFELARSIILGTTSSDSPAISSADIDQIIDRRLRAPHRFHRDGFLFQLMMWLSAHSDLAPDDLIALPHSQPSAKGQDGIIVHRSPTSVVNASICEDKATKSPRKTIRTLVWPEITDYESGGRDDELRSSIIATLGMAGITSTEATKLIRGIAWAGKRHYRVRVTVGDTKARRSMFKGFSKKTQNGKSHCRGETVHLPNLRNWMDGFASLVETELRALAV